MRCHPQLSALVLIALAVRSLSAQSYAPSPGERGDSYSPAGTQPRVQAHYPLPQPAIPGPPPPSASAPPAAQGPPPIREPLPQQAGFQVPSSDPAAPPAVANEPPNQVFEPNKIVATVGSEFILYGDISGAVEQYLAPILPQVKTDSDRAELQKIREQLTKQMLGQIINTKLMYLEFLRSVEKSAGRDKLPEIHKNIDSQMGKRFEEELTKMRSQIATSSPSEIQKLVQRDMVLPRLAILMRENQAETLPELDNLLRGYGSSLAKQLRLYTEDRLGRDNVRRHVFTSEEVSHLEMLDYYTANAADFAVPAKARFEILTVKFDNFRTKSEAWNTLAQMGNEVYFGAPFAAIARKHSQEPNAEKGGLYDWTTQGSLASKPIDQAIFTLESNKLSQIIEDERGYHIVRVLERTDAGQVPFQEAQPKIQEAIKLQRREAEYKKFVESLRTKTQVWTIYDDETALARQPGTTSMR